MTTLIEWLSRLGDIGLWWYGLPLLAWTLLGGFVLIGLRFVKNSTRSFTSAYAKPCSLR